MVLSDNKENNKEMMDGDENKKKNETMPKKLFSCAELERSIGLRRDDPHESSENALKRVDSAVISSSKIPMTRYSRDEMLVMRQNDASQLIPSCLFNPKIADLKIMNSQLEHMHIQNQLQIFTERLKQVTFGNNGLDPGLSTLFASYQRSLLNYPFANPSYGQPNPFYVPSNVAQQPKRQVSIVEQADLFDKIPSYDRNNNFFDTITTTTAFPPPTKPRNDTFYHHTGYNRTQYYQPSNRKGNSCAMERDNINNVSTKSYGSDANTTKSSFDNSMNEEKSNEMTMNASKHVDSLVKLVDDDNEPEPEWYSVPATVDDFVELHGFEEGMDEKKPNNRSNGYGTPSLAYRRSSYSQNRNQNRNSQQNTHQQGYSNTQRFRNPLHFPKFHNHNQQQQQQSPAYQNPAINSFPGFIRTSVDCPVNFNALNSRYQNGPTNFQSIVDIEHALKTKNYLQSLMKQNQQQQAMSSSVPQFFSNWSQNDSPPIIPTQEQLQIHTNEIMRNAILRKQQAQKQQQQQYHDEKSNFY